MSKIHVVVSMELGISFPSRNQGAVSMAQEQFTRREVDRAFRKFKDLCDDLFQAKFQAWGHSFTHLIKHCEENPVMRAVTDPLRANKNVDARKWYNDALASVTGMVGSGHYELPIDDNDRTALLYQFFLLIENEGIDVDRFCTAVYGDTQYQAMVSHFNQELVHKFTREVSYRLDEIIEDIGESAMVPREAMHVFHYHDHSLSIQGGIHGSNLAIGASTISDSTASYNSGADLVEALKSLRPLLHEVKKDQHDIVEIALQTLIRSAEGEQTTPEQLKQSIETLAKTSPGIGERLKGIAGKIGLSLLSSSMFQAMKSYFNIH
jgi:hypothetical protein